MLRFASNRRGLSVLPPVRKEYPVLLADNITQILPSLSWQGCTCFILGGGPSVEQQDLQYLHKQKVIGINKAFMKYPVDINYSMDETFFDSVQYTTDPRHKDFLLHQSWLVFSGVKLFLLHDHKSRFAQGVYYVKEVLEKCVSLDLSQGIYAGNNSGLGALMLAVALGCKRIGLLGYDFLVQGEKTHWHEGYGFCLKDVISSLEKFRACIDEFGPAILELGIDVVNLSPTSALKSFPKKTIQEFLGVS